MISKEALDALNLRSWVKDNLVPEIRRAARPQMRYSVADWADRHRVLDPINCSIPGPWKTDFAPFMRGILDTYSDDTCSDLAMMGGTQWGKTESMLNMLLWTIDQEPMPTLFVLPTEADAVSFARRRLKTACEFSPKIEEYRTEWKSDWKTDELGFSSMVVYLGWSNSPSKLASRSIGRLFLDEVDKYPGFTGGEADPISLAKERLRWWRNSRRVVASTPTTTDGYIWTEWCNSDQRWYWVPCPFCKRYQRLVFSKESVVFPKTERDPARIRLGRLARYVCRHCKKEIPDSAEVKQDMMMRGTWVPEGGKVSRAGNITGVRLDAAFRGFHVNALYSPMLSWSDVAAEFLESKDDYRRLMNFINSWTGWPWIEKSEENTIDHLLSRVGEHERNTVPDGVQLLTAGVDVQKDFLYWEVWGWGYGERATLIDFGRCERFEQLEYELWDSRPVALAAIDSGYRTDEVYRFVERNSDRARAVKGSQSLATPLRTAKLQRDYAGRAGGLMLWHVDTTYFKDKIVRCRHADPGAPGSVVLFDEPPEEWLRQQTSEHKVMTRNRTTKALKEIWTKRAGAGGNHWWDCSVYAYAAADMIGVYRLRAADPPVAPPVTARMEDEVKEARRYIRKVRKSWIRKRGQRPEE